MTGRDPSIVDRFSSTALLRELERLLRQERWDAVIVDNIAVAGAARVVRRARLADRPVVVYLSHNHEASVRTQAARHHRGNPVTRAAARFDAWKAGRAESALIAAADLVTANTAEDEAAFRAGTPGLRTLVLTPAYDGPVDTERPITADRPRRAVVLGSFGWTSKQSNLVRFLEAAAPLFAAARAELAVVGSIPPAFEAEVRRRFPSVALHPDVPDVRPHLGEARLGVVPEELGGGFKHKVLHYVFNGVPVAAIAGAVTGVPLRPGSGILEYPSIDALAAGAVAVIDALDRLNEIRVTAARACAGGFDWADRGMALLTAVAEARARAPGVRPATSA
jgi:glycosyltransferase involved in cell wall biosynthesis